MSQQRKLASPPSLALSSNDSKCYSMPFSVSARSGGTRQAKNKTAKTKTLQRLALQQIKVRPKARGGGGLNKTPSREERRGLGRTAGSGWRAAATTAFVTRPRPQSTRASERASERAADRLKLSNFVRSDFTENRGVD